MAIAEELTSMLKSRHKDEAGNTASVISLNDVEIISYHPTDEFTIIEANLLMRTDIGDFEALLVIKKFTTFKLFQDELVRHSDLEARCLRFPDIEPFSVMKIDKDELRIIYDMANGKTADQLEIDPDILDTTWGRILAVLQGQSSISLEHTSIRELLTYIIDYLPFSEDEKMKFSMLLEPHFPIIDRTVGGYFPATLFDPTRVRFRLVRDKGGKIVIKIEVQIHDPGSQAVDRMADVASIFAERAYTEFIETGAVEATKISLKNLFRGYNNVSVQFGDVKLEQMYPNGITLDLQMLISFFLMRLNASEKPFSEPDEVRYIYFLLIKKPFLLF